MRQDLAQGFLASGTCFGQPLSRRQGCLAIFSDCRGVMVLVWWSTFVVVGVTVVVVVRVEVGGEVGIRGCDHCLHHHYCCLRMWHYQVLVMRHVGHARMVLVPTCQVVLEGELWDAPVDPLAVSNIVHVMLHVSKIVERHGSQW
jgi:hypothetical protein